MYSRSISMITFLSFYIRLKDDDSGSGTEDNIAPTNEENEMYKKVVPGPDEHQLQYTYCFWFSKKPPGRDDPANFEKSVRVIATFVTVRRKYCSENFSINSKFSLILRCTFFPFSDIAT